MGIDWGEALASGIASGAGAVEHQQQQQQDDARWMDRMQKMQAMETESAKAKERYLLGLKPPETRKLNVTGADNKPAIQQQEWKIAPGADTGDWQNVGDQTPNIDFEKLEETQRNNDLKNQAAADRLDVTSRLGEARIDAANARADAAAARRSGRAEEPKAYTTTDPKTGKATQVYGWFDSDGKFRQATDASGAPLGGDKFRPSVYEEKNATQQAKVDAVKGTLSQFASAIGLGAAANAMPSFTAGSTPRPAATQPAAAATPPPAGAQPGASPHGKVVRTGTQNGQRVAQYEDGYIGPAP